MKENHSGSRVVIYARSSTKEASAAQTQVADAEQWIAANGAAHVATFVDSGTATPGRPGLQALLAAVAGGAESDTGPADVVLVNSLSRLFRNQSHLDECEALLARQQVKIVAMTGCESKLVFGG